MKYNGVIQRKLALLDSQVLKISEHLVPISWKEFSDSWTYQTMAERALQVSIETVIDVAERIIALEGAGPAATGRESLDKLKALGIIRDPTPYQRMVGMRNIIVHEYAEVDPEVLYRAIQTHLRDFRMFRDEIDGA